MRSLSRRQALFGALAAAAVPTTANASIVDPHAAWVEEWAELERLSWEFDPVPVVLEKEINRFIDLIMDTPALTPDGMLAKIRYVRASFLDDGSASPSKELISQLEAFIGAQA